MSEALSSELSDPPQTSPTRPLPSSPPNPLSPSSSKDDSPSPTPRRTASSRPENDNDFSSFAFEDEPGQAKAHCDCCGHRRMWEAEKIEYIFALLRKWRWNFKKLLEIVYDRRTERQFVQHFSECDSFLRDHDSAGYIKLSQDEQERVFYSHIGWEWIIRQLRAELEELTNLEVFGPFSVEKRMENINLLENIVPAVELKAPHLCGLLQSLDHPATAKKTAPKVLSSRHILMMSMMCMSLHRKKCSNLPTSFGIYMLDGGAN